MSALPSPIENPQGSSDTAADPSMEEILASIRRIIADDHGTPITPRPSRAAAEPEPAPVEAPEPRPEPVRQAIEPPPARQPLESSRSFARDLAAARESHQSRQLSASRESPLLERLARMEGASSRPRSSLRHSFDQQPQPAAPSPAHEDVLAALAGAPGASGKGGDSLLSPLTNASVASAFEALTVSMAVQNESVVEQAVRDMLRPMLKQWLDDNLPTIVERLVRAEIERVARGGRA